MEPLAAGGHAANFSPGARPTSRAVSLDLVIRGGLVVQESGRVVADIAVRDGRIAAVGDRASAGPAAEIIDARGRVVLPGSVDGHVHFNEPGRAHWEGWKAGTRGAAAGGVTTVLDMPLNASPPTITAADFDTKQALASRSALVDYGLWGGLVDDNLAHLEALHGRGVVGFKAFLSDSGVEDFKRVSAELLDAGLRITARLGALVGIHAEDHEMTQALAAGLRAGGRTDRWAWALARPPAAELAAINRVVAAGRAAGAGARRHVVHVSAADGIELIQRARAEGQAVTAETCPHYLAFTDEDFLRIGPALKCAPPIRDAANRERLWRAVLAGRVDVVGSDHSPCPAADKRKGETNVWEAWGGIAGIQATLPVMLTEGFHARRLSWERLAELLATNPAKLFGLYPRKGAIRVGADADFALVDPGREWTFDADQLHTRSGISPYLGRRFRGAVVRTIVRGRTVYVQGEVVGEPGYGRLVQPQEASSRS